MTTPNHRDRALDSNLIDEVCDEFEAKLQQNGEADILEFVSRVEPRLRDRLVIELLDLDREHTLGRGGSPSREDYLRRYPSLRRQIEEYNFRRGAAQPNRGPADPRPPALNRGAMLGRYELDEAIGRGASAEVWKAKELLTGRVVALKIAHTAGTPNEGLRRFLREGRCASQLAHANIVRLYDAVREGPFAFLVYAYSRGGTLREVIERGGLPLDQAVTIAEKLARALHYAHGVGILHRDVKPANVLLDDAGEPQLTDFGLARWDEDTGQATLHHHVMGTPAYMSPEQARGDHAQVDCRTDIYSLGVVLFELLTARRAYSGSADHVLAKLSANAEDFLSPRRQNRRVSRDIDTVCCKATQRRVEDRYANAAAMAEDLARCLRGETPLARQPSLTVRVWRRVRRRPAGAVIIGLLIAVAALSGVVARAGRNELRPVVIETDPVGARVAFVPLDSHSGQPKVAEAVFSAGDGRAVAWLSPGMHLVVAAMADGRFHEVYRWVPEPTEQPLATGLLSSHLSEDGRLELHQIRLPEDRKIDLGPLITGSLSFPIGRTDQSGGGQRGGARVRSFYIDLTEFTVADARTLPKWIRNNLAGLPGDHAFTADFYQAMAAAERVGKRLPTEIEYEYAATNGGEHRYPWGDSFPDAGPIERFGPVGDVEFDRTASGGVRDLCSNVAEWTISLGPISYGNLNDFRVIRGGDLSVVQGDASVASQSRDPLNRLPFPPDTSSSGLGFRCVRSEHPLIGYEEMVTR